MSYIVTADDEASVEVLWSEATSHWSAGRTWLASTVKQSID